MQFAKQGNCLIFGSCPLWRVRAFLVWLRDLPLILALSGDRGLYKISLDSSFILIVAVEAFRRLRTWQPTTKTIVIKNTNTLRIDPTIITLHSLAL